MNSTVKRLDSTGKTNVGTKMRYRASIQCFNYKVYLNNQTKVFVVPEVTEIYDSAGSFRMEKPGYLADNKDYTNEKEIIKELNDIKNKINKL